MKGNISDIRIRLLPRSSKNEIIGREGDVYRVKVTSPPINGKANRALISLLSKKLRVSKGSIEIITGERSKIKQIRIHGLSKDKINKILNED